MKSVEAGDEPSSSSSNSMMLGGTLSSITSADTPVARGCASRCASRASRGRLGAGLSAGVARGRGEAAPFVGAFDVTSSRVISATPPPPLSCC